MSNGLPENVRKLFLTFKKAIGAEKAAQAMYMRAKDLTDDDILKEVLEGFYQDEVRHERELIDHYNKMREDSGEDLLSDG